MANVIIRMPILSFLKQEAKVENKQELTMEKAMEPFPSTSHEQSTMLEGARPAQMPTEEVRQEAAKKEDDEPEAEVTDEYFKKVCPVGKRKRPRGPWEIFLRSITFRESNKWLHFWFHV